MGFIIKAGFPLGKHPPGNFPWFGSASEKGREENRVREKSANRENRPAKSSPGASNPVGFQGCESGNSGIVLETSLDWSRRRHDPASSRSPQPQMPPQPSHRRLSFCWTCEAVGRSASDCSRTGCSERPSGMSTEQWPRKTISFQRRRLPDGFRTPQTRPPAEEETPKQQARKKPTEKFSGEREFSSSCVHDPRGKVRAFALLRPLLIHPNSQLLAARILLTDLGVCQTLKRVKQNEAMLAFGEVLLAR
jgi:hypothetical protein